MELIYKGAEAELYKGMYLGMPCAIKRRVRKPYKIAEIDDRIRRERIKCEAINLVKAKQAVKAPHIYDVDMADMSITMEYVGGKKVRDMLDKEPELGGKIGKAVSRLHGMNMVHGDLTTSNLILKGKDIYFIDFGLAYISGKAEDKAVDLQVFRDVIRSTHHTQFEKIWEGFVRGYADKKVLKKLEDVDKRARYKHKT